MQHQLPKLKQRAATMKLNKVQRRVCSCAISAKRNFFQCFNSFVETTLLPLAVERELRQRSKV